MIVFTLRFYNIFVVEIRELVGLQWEVIVSINSNINCIVLITMLMFTPDQGDAIPCSTSSIL